MTQHPRHKATQEQEQDTSQHTKALQGAYGSGGSYGVGGGFRDDEPGSRVEDDGAPSGDSGQRVPDVHTREAEENDAYLREVRRKDQQRNAAKKRQR